MKYKVIALMGEAGTGKDTLLKKMKESAPDLFHSIVSYTTRPKREKEIDGVDYHFISTEDFAKKVLNNEMLEATNFNDWFYGTGLDDLKKDKINIGVFNPTGVEALMFEKNKIDLKVFRIKTSDKTRMLRQLNRELNPNVHEIIRRFKADWLDFDDLSDLAPYEEIQNETIEDLEVSIQKILASLREDSWAD